MIYLGPRYLRYLENNDFSIRNECHCLTKEQKSLVHHHFEELSRLTEIKKAYSLQTEVDGLSRFGRPRMGEMDFLSREILLRNYKLGDGVLWEK